MAINYNALGQAIDTTWGRSSTPRTASYSVKFDVNGPDAMTAKYCAIVSFASEGDMQSIKKRYGVESDSVVSAVLDAVKKRYKQLADSTLRVKQVGEEDSLEIVSMNFHNPKRSAYYRKSVRLEISG